MEIFFTVYWAIVVLLVIFCLIGGITEGSVLEGFGVGVILLILACVCRVILDPIVPMMPITVTEITQEVKFIEYGYNLGIEGQIIRIDNPLIYEGLVKDVSLGKTKFYKNYRPKHEKSWNQENIAVYRAFRGDILVFEHRVRVM